MIKRILVTGGAGYIGSHACLALLEADYEVVVLDNLANGSLEALRRVEGLAGKTMQFHEGDIRDAVLLEGIFATESIDAVLHFAGLKAVGESVERPLDYYENNVYGTLVLCKAMARAGVYTLVFSSSATVYGEPDSVPLSETSPTKSPSNPYGRSKLFVEEMLADLSATDKRWSIAMLRYFNPVGAHPSGWIGEDPRGVPNNLLPYLAQVAVGQREELLVFGNDYPTPDGTGVRDYIHVVDLVEGHLCALRALSKKRGAHIWNLGTGVGYSVLEMIKALEQASGREISWRVVGRRPGDVAECWADCSKAQTELGWAAQRTLQDMMADTWRWQSKNPHGYKEWGLTPIHVNGGQTPNIPH